MSESTTPAAPPPVPAGPRAGLLDMGRLAGFLQNANKYSDIYLALLIVAIIALMILPLNPHVIDVLIAVNLSVAILLLMTSLYIRRAINLYTFPSLLLISTLFRLSLAIATTRQILMNGYAGDIIQTFGDVVVGGNFVVGAVIFLIITIVQFLVVTKGSERVAEVAARFTLDAMPGKQMSIDADARANTITVEEARVRRDALEKESQLYGSMDGAMKFVKGDAIAGLIVIIVNIVGGISIGVILKGMTVVDALQTYAILTIGDGLISQIPALFTSVTSGIIVTKVTSDDSEHLGGDIGKQLLAEPKSLLIGGSVIAGFGLMPGFPKIPFFLLGGLAAATGHAMRVAARKAAEKAEASKKEGPVEPEPPPKRVRALPMPLVVELHASLKGFIDPGKLWDQLERLIVRLEAQTGIPYPSFQVYFSGYLEDKTFNLHLNEIPWARGVLEPGRLLVREALSTLETIEIDDYIEGPGHSESRPAYWIPDENEILLQRLEIPYTDNYRIVLMNAERMIRKHSADFLGLYETKMMLDQVEPMIDAVVKEAIRAITVPRIAEVLQRLAREQISVRNIKAILEALVDWSTREKDVIQLSEQVRVALGRQISHWYGAGSNTIPAWTLDAELENLVRKHIKVSPHGSNLVLPPGVGEKIVAAVKRERDAAEGAYPPPVVITALDVRRYVKVLLESEIENQAVLSYQELPRDTVVHTLTRISAS
jgi:type III secretion protein V